MPVADTQWQNLIKITKVRKGSNYEPYWRFKGVACVSSNQRPHVVWITVASQCVQIARLANFPTSFSFYSCVKMDGNPTFTVHATAHAFRAAINLNSMLLRQQTHRSDVSKLFDGFDVVLKVTMIVFICGMLNKSWLLLQNSNCKWATALSALVVITIVAEQFHCSLHVKELMLQQQNSKDKL